MTVGDMKYVDQLELGEDDHELRDKIQLMLDSDAWKYVDRVLQAFTMEALQGLTRKQATEAELRWYQGKVAALGEFQEFLIDAIDKEDQDEDYIV